jgi:hypothetical protein
MTDTSEDNTRWICLWIINDPVHYDAAQRAAQNARDVDIYDILRMWVEAAFARTATPAIEYISREMTDADMDTVDWEEVASDLID